MAVAMQEGRVVPATLQLRDVEVSGSGRKQWLEGRAVPYNSPQNIGWFTEVFLAGAFAKSIREAANGLPLLLFHESGTLDAHVGKAHEWREQDDGLHGVWRLADGDVAQRTASMVEQGLLGYLSVGFQPIRSASVFDDDDNLTITRQEARLLEVSLVSTPAYSEATITKVRTAAVEMHREVAGREIAGWRQYLESVQADTR